MLGTAGLLAELALLSHWESAAQTVPLVALPVGVLAAGWLARAPSSSTVRIFRGAMLSWVVIGAVGIWLHFEENWEFERELAPARAGAQVVWRAITGASPLLAPGALVQLGLLGLILTYDHPALRRGAANREEESR